MGEKVSSKVRTCITILLVITLGVSVINLIVIGKELVKHGISIDDIFSITGLILVIMVGLMCMLFKTKENNTLLCELDKTYSINIDSLPKIYLMKRKIEKFDKVKLLPIAKERYHIDENMSYSMKEKLAALKTDIKNRLEKSDFFTSKNLIIVCVAGLYVLFINDTEKEKLFQMLGYEFALIVLLINWMKTSEENFKNRFILEVVESMEEEEEKR